MPDAPAIDLSAEATQLWVQAAPGGVFLGLRCEWQGRTLRQMFVEMTVLEALLLQQELQGCIHTAIHAARDE